MYSAISYYEITLIHFFTILSYLLIRLKYNVHFFLIAQANVHKITQKKQRPGPNPDDIGIKTAIFCRSEKVQFGQRLVCTTTLNK